jgi:hypothetical protein
MTVGLAATLAACCCSGLAGVYFEKILKKSEVGDACRQEWAVDNVLFRAGRGGGPLLFFFFLLLLLLWRWQ